MNGEVGNTAHLCDRSLHSLVNMYSQCLMECRGNCGAISKNTNLIHWPLMGGLLHLVQRGGSGRGHSLPRPMLTVPNVTAHPSTAIVPIAAPPQF